MEAQRRGRSKVITDISSASTLDESGFLKPSLSHFTLERETQ